MCHPDKALLSLAKTYVPRVYKQIIKYLDTHGQGSVDDIAPAIHTSPSCVRKAFQVMKQHKIVRPCAWRKVHLTGVHVPIYELGSGEGIPRPPAISQAEYSRQRRLKQKIAARPLTMAEMCGVM